MWENDVNGSRELPVYKICSIDAKAKNTIVFTKILPFSNHSQNSTKSHTYSLQLRPRTTSVVVLP